MPNKKQTKGQRIAQAIIILESTSSYLDKLNAKLELAKLVPEYAKLPRNSQGDLIFKMLENKHYTTGE